MKYSVIDISSTSVSMIVAEVKGKEAEVLFRDRAGLTLIHYLQGKNLSPRGIDKVVAAVSEMKQRCVQLGAEALLLISTASLRAIGNFEEVGAAVLNRTGVPINAVGGRLEAFCDLVANRAYASLDRAAILDIGGGSIEVCDLNEKGGELRISLDFGLLNLHAKFVENIQPGEEEGRRIRKYLARKADKAGIPGEGLFDTVIFVGATGQALLGVYEEYYGGRDGHSMSAKKFKKLTKHLLSGHDRSRLILDAAPDKLYSVGIGAVIARTFIKRFGAERILVSDRGVKEGFLLLFAEGRESAAYYDVLKGRAVFPAGERSGEGTPAVPGSSVAAAKRRARPGSGAAVKKTDAGKVSQNKKTETGKNAASGRKGRGTTAAGAAGAGKQKVVEGVQSTEQKE